MGKGAGNDVTKLEKVLGAGEKMMGMFKSSTPVNYGWNFEGDDYAQALPSQLLLHPKFWNSSGRMQVQTVAHESVHHIGAWDTPRIDPSTRLTVPAYGYPNIVRQAQFSSFSQMMETPDAVSFAFGFDRDDD